MSAAAAGLRRTRRDAGLWRRVGRPARSDGPDITTRPRFGLPALAAQRRDAAEYTVGVLVYRGVTTAEIDSPVRRLADRLAADVRFVGSRVGPVHGVEPSRTVIVDTDPDHVGPVDVLVVPGGLGWRQVIDDPVVRRWIIGAAEEASAILAVSTGSLLLAAIGRLNGREATGHWLAGRDLAALGAVVSSERAVSADAGRLVTVSGVRAAETVADAVADRVSWSRS